MHPWCVFDSSSCVRRLPALLAARRRRADRARLEHQAVHARAHRRRSRAADARGRDRRRARQRQRRPEVLRRRSRDEHQDRRADRARQRGVPDADGADLRRQRGLQHQDRLGTFNIASASRSSASAASATAACSARSSRTCYFYGETIEKIGPDKYRITQGRLHDLRAADAAVGDRQRQRHDQPATTTSILRNAVIQVKDVPVFYLPMLYYPIQEDDRATGFLLPTYGSSLATRLVDQQRVLLGDQPQPGRHLLPRLDVLARQRASAPSIATCSGRRRRATSRYYWLDEKEAVINGSTRPARAEHDRFSGGLSQNLPFGLSARGRVDYFTNVTRAADLQPQLLRTPRTATAAIDGGVSGSWRSLSAERHVPAHRDVLQRRTNSTVSGRSAGLHRGAQRRAGSGRCRCSRSVNAEAGADALHQKLRRANRRRSQPDQGGRRAVDPRAAQHAAVPAGQRHGGVSHDVFQREPRRRPEDADRGADDAPLRRHARRRGRAGVLARLQSATTRSPIA